MTYYISTEKAIANLLVASDSHIDTSHLIGLRNYLYENCKHDCLFELSRDSIQEAILVNRLYFKGTKDKIELTNRYDKEDIRDLFRLPRTIEKLIKKYLETV